MSQRSRESSVLCQDRNSGNQRVKGFCRDAEMAVEDLWLKPALGSGSGVGRTRLLVFPLLSTDHVPGPSSWPLHGGGAGM